MKKKIEKCLHADGSAGWTNAFRQGKINWHKNVIKETSRRDVPSECDGLV